MKYNINVHMDKHKKITFSEIKTMKKQQLVFLNYARQLFPVM